MADPAKLFNLFWRADVASQPPTRVARVALQHLNVLDELEPIPGIILFPAFLTPAIHAHGQGPHGKGQANGHGMFEILIYSRKAPTITPSDINWHLKITVGLDPTKPAHEVPLFTNPADLIEVSVVTPDNGVLATPNTFRGQLHKSFRHPLAPPPQGSKGGGASGPEGEFYAVRISETCLADAPVLHGRSAGHTRELQDELIESTLKKMNGPALRGDHKQGTHCFARTAGSAGGADLWSIDETQPICAYHPLFLYPNAKSGPANFGHVSDIHISTRQELLRLTQARVIDDPRAADDSPPIGGLVNVCSQNFNEILQKLGSGNCDVLLAGGDYVDHSRNVYPCATGSLAQETKRAAHEGAATPRQVWSWMDLKSGYDTNYQDFVDLISFYCDMLWFCTSFGKPIFAITGNHDCYSGAFGISPRIVGRPTNKGIPADHNMTLYEAILAFGDTWDVLKKHTGSPFDPPRFEWFYNVCTPWSDFNIELPKQRLVCLAWGEDEGMLDPVHGQGLGHLPRASECITSTQLELFKHKLSAGKKTVLMTHFTFVSYEESVPEFPPDPPTPNKIETAGHIVKYSDYDLGTFQEHRKDLYDEVAAGQRVQFVITGHSHRKGLYLLGQKTGTEYATEMHSLREPLDLQAQGFAAQRTPIIVSDSAGPLPRQNVNNEFWEWGSDRPSGTLVESGTDGRVATVTAVAVDGIRTKPRLPVTLEFLHVIRKSVFDSIETFPFPKNRPTTFRHGINVNFTEQFAGRFCFLQSLVLYCQASTNSSWLRIPMIVNVFDGPPPTDQPQRSVACGVPPDDGMRANFYEWLTMAPKPARFMSMRFRFVDPVLEEQYQQQDGANAAWNFEVYARPAYTNIFHTTDITYVIQPKRDTHWYDPTDVGEAPSFEWRRRFPAYQ
jgi:hypothetical protein